MHAFQYIAKFFCFVRNIAIPPFCAVCHVCLEHDALLCDPCLGAIKPIVSKTIAITPSKEMKVFAVGLYNGPLSSLILAKKWSNRTIARHLGELIWDLTHVRNNACDIIVPIPLHWTRFAWRGYNQAHEISLGLSRKNNKPVHAILKREKRTPFQTAIAFEKRHENVKDAFVLAIKDASLYQDKHIILVDDVMTSGATLQMAAKQLLKLNPASITAVVVART